MRDLAKFSFGFLVIISVAFLGFVVSAFIKSRDANSPTATIDNIAHVR